MRKALRRLQRLHRPRAAANIERQLNRVPEGALKSRLVEVIGLVNRLLAQKPKDKKKLYSLHEPAVDCISKGKAHKRYEFGTEVSVATTNRGGFVVGMRALPGTPYDGHTLSEELEQVRNPEHIRDPRWPSWIADIEAMAWRLCGRFHQRGAARRDQDNSQTRRRRSAIEPMIGYMKNDGRLTRRPLKGTEGDALFAAPAAAAITSE